MLLNLLTISNNLQVKEKTIHFIRKQKADWWIPLKASLNFIHMQKNHIYKHHTDSLTVILMTQSEHQKNVSKILLCHDLLIACAEQRKRAPQTRPASLGLAQQEGAQFNHIPMFSTLVQGHTLYKTYPPTFNLVHIRISSPGYLWPIGPCAALRWTPSVLSGSPVACLWPSLGSTRRPPNLCPAACWCPFPRNTQSLE